MTTPNPDAPTGYPVEGTPPSEDTTEALTWVPLTEAAQAAGVSVSALRKWYGKSGQIPSRMDPTGPTGPRRLVPLEAVLERASHRRGGERAAPPTPPSTPGPYPLIPLAVFEAVQAAYLEAQGTATAAEVRAQVAEYQLTRIREREADLEARLAEERSRFRFRRVKPPR